jgi:DNA polymerase I-like protein with 3'-5' exonuclease and polymerase domains
MKILTIDFETYYDKEYSLSKLTTEQYVRDPRFEVILVSVKVGDEPPVWFSGSMRETKFWLDQFEMHKHGVCAHHMAFDGFILNHHFGIRPKFLLDTLSMARPKHAGTIGVSLKALSDHYTVGIKGDEVIQALGKHRCDFTPQELERYAEYCVTDVQLTFLLLRILRKDFPMGELRIIDTILRMFTEPVLQLDAHTLNTHLLDVQRRREEALASVAAIADVSELRSNPKFAEVLSNLGVDPPMKVSPRTGKQTYAFSKVDAQFKALLEHDDLRVQAVVAARLGVKSSIEETRTEAFLGIAQRGPMPIPISYYGAHTGRGSGWDKINPQNLPRGGALRKSMVAPPGHLLVACDSSQIEARVVAWLAGQKDLLQDFRNKADVYSKFASIAFGRPIDRKREEIGPDGLPYNPDFNEGFVGKTCVLGLGFGMSGAKLHLTLKTAKTPVIIPEQECYRIVNTYRKTYRRIEQLWYDADTAVQIMATTGSKEIGPTGVVTATNKAIYLPNGMQIRYPHLTQHPIVGKGYAYVKTRKQLASWTIMKLTGDWDFQKLTPIFGAKAIENVVQALARIIVFDQMLRIAALYRVVLNAHDENVVCVPEEQAEAARDYMTEVMSIPPVWAPDLPVACEAKIGKTYGEAK